MAFDLQVFNEQTHLVMTETIDQEVEKFNAASSGTIQLINQAFKGDFDIRSSFKTMAGLVRRRNVYADTAVAGKRLEQRKDVAVKVAAGTPPILWEPAQYTWTKQNPEAAAITIGTQLGKGKIADMLNAGLSAAVSAISSNTDAVHAATAEATFKELNTGASKFGDRSGAIKAWILHSTVMHQLFNNALTNAERLFEYNGVNVIRDPFGRVFVVTDSPALAVTDAGATTYKTLGMTEGGLIVNTNDDFNAVIVDKTGKENIQAEYQAEWSFGVSVDGYSWNEATGGKSPNDTAIGTSANWTQVATSSKDTAGVLVEST